MVLPTRPLLTFSLAISRLSFSARPPHSFAQYGVTAPFIPTHAFTWRRMEEMIRFSAAPRLKRRSPSAAPAPALSIRSSAWSRS